MPSEGETSMWGRKKNEQVDTAAVDRLRDALRNDRQQRFAAEDSSVFGVAHPASSTPEIQERALEQMESEAGQTPPGSSTHTADVLTERVRALQERSAKQSRCIKHLLGRQGAA